MCHYLKQSLVFICILGIVIEVEPGCGYSKVFYLWHNADKHILKHHGDLSGYVIEGQDPSGKDDEFIALSDEELDKAAELMKDIPINNATREADRRIWYDNAWRVFNWLPVWLVPEQDRKDVPVVHNHIRAYTLNDKRIFPTAAELAISDAKKKLWHKGAWHDAVWKDNAMNSYVDGDTFVTLTSEEVHESDRKQMDDAKKQKFNDTRLWHNGNWRKGIVKDGMLNSYMAGSKPVTLTPEELAISDAKKQEKLNIK